MKKLVQNKKLWRGVCVWFLTFAIIFMMVGRVAASYASALNYALGTSSYKVVENPDAEQNSTYFPSDYDSPEAIAAYGKTVSEAVESEGLVLIKNKNNALPLEKGTNVSTVLQTAYSFSYGSSGSGAIDATKYSDFKTALTNAGLNVNETLWSFYSQNPSSQAITYNRKGDPLYKVNALSLDNYTDEAKASIEETGGAALVVIGRLSGEGADDSTKKSDGYDGSYLSLTKEEIQILSRLTELKNAGALNSITVIINTAQIFETAFLDDNWTIDIDGEAYTIDVDACIWAGNVGIGGIDALAKTIVGDYVPSGRLPDTYVKDNFSSPAAASWILQNDSGVYSSKYENAALATSDNQLKYGVYLEGIYVGYRYYETRYEDTVLGRDDSGEFVYSDNVSRPFGYGLSYTAFEYSDFKVSEAASGDYDISIKVTNTGDYSGKHSVLIYLQKPYTEYDIANGVEKASVELAAFEKTDLLKPGESQTLTMTVEREQLKSYDANNANTYILEQGEYYLAIGSSAHDAVNNILALKGYTESDGMDDKGDSNLACLIGQDITFDAETYSVSTETGAKISNKLDFADINKYEGRGDNQVTYVTRSDWAGSFPKAAVSLALTERLASDLETQKAIQEDVSLEMPEYGKSNGLSLIMMKGLDFDAEEWNDLLDQMTWEEQSTLVMLAGYGTFGAVSISLPEIKSEDGPTGVVSSMDSISFPSEGIWAASFNTKLIEQVGDALAEDARNVNVEGLYLPGINIHRAPFGGRTHEYFSEDPYLSGIAVENEIKGLQAKGVTPYVKHYAFNDEEDARIGIGIWLNEQTAREIYLKPFEYAVAPSHGNAHGVMSSFNRAGAIWTSASSELMEDILRGEFGFDGVVLTDMALGQNAYMSYDALAKGTDLFLDPTGAQTQFDEYAQSATFRHAVRNATHRYLYTMVNTSAAMNGFSADTKVVEITPWWQMTLNICEIACFAIGGISLIMLIASLINESKRKADAK